MRRFCVNQTVKYEEESPIARPKWLMLYCLEWKGSPMNSHQLAIVQSSFAQVEPVADQVADLFYARLFEMHPEFRPLFPQEMDLQKAKLIAMLTFIVESLMMLDALIPALQQLGERHQGYGVINDYYRPLGAALIWALEQALGDQFTPEMRRAWVGVYTMMANTMINAANQVSGDVEGAT
jgi:hemoglobin-like flavoprotein